MKSFSHLFVGLMLCSSLALAFASCNKAGNGFQCIPFPGAGACPPDLDDTPLCALSTQADGTPGTSDETAFLCSGSGVDFYGAQRWQVFSAQLASAGWSPPPPCIVLVCAKTVPLAVAEATREAAEAGLDATGIQCVSYAYTYGQFTRNVGMQYLPAAAQAWQQPGNAACVSKQNQPDGGAIRPDAGGTCTNAQGACDLTGTLGLPECCPGLTCDFGSPGSVGDVCCVEQWDACTEDADCCGKQICETLPDNPLGPRFCCTDENRACAADGDCCRGTCTGGYCQCLTVDEPCSSQNDCCVGMGCIDPGGLGYTVCR